MAILNDNDFGHLVQSATEVTARIGLDYERRTVKKGALFYQEFLPPETLMYAVVLAENSRRKDWNNAGKNGARDILAVFREGLPKTLQIGADETIGKGLCQTQMPKPK